MYFEKARNRRADQRGRVTMHATRVTMPTDFLPPPQTCTLTRKQHGGGPPTHPPFSMPPDCRHRHYLPLDKCFVCVCVSSEMQVSVSSEMQKFPTETLNFSSFQQLLVSPSPSLRRNSAQSSRSPCGNATSSSLKQSLRNWSNPFSSKSKFNPLVLCPGLTLKPLLTRISW